MPAYLELHHAGELRKRAEQAVAGLASCAMCPRQCRADRLRGETGECGGERHAVVAGHNLHFGEEAPLVGDGGSGTIFLAGCNLYCDFCQNFDISHHPSEGMEAAPHKLARIMLSLQESGARNINFVTPSHVAAQILEALPLAADLGLNLPLVYNSSGYDSLDTLRLLHGVVDIYMPDAKFFSSAPAQDYCRAGDYPEIARSAIKEMHRQVGDLVLDHHGLATRGLLVRHLIMPDNLAETSRWMDFLAREISPHTYVNIMDQYRPCGRASRHPELMRSITPAEYRSALQAAQDAGITRLDDRPSRQAAYLLRQLLKGL